MITCAACHDEQEAVPSLHTPPPLVHFKCCDEALCGACLPSAITVKIGIDMFYDLEQDTFLQCPIDDCNGILDIKTLNDMCHLYLRARAGKDAGLHVQFFRRALSLRKSLAAAGATLSPLISTEAVLLYGGLSRAAVSRNLFTDIMNTRDETVEFLDILSSDQEPNRRAVRVPVFSSLLYKRDGRRAARTCTVCEVDHYDVRIRFPRAWKRECDKFRGNLHFLAERFPTARILSACAHAHNFDICKECINQHMKAHLEERGTAAVNTLRCPTPGCAHVYSPDEIRVLTGASTLLQYERLSLLRALATEPAFRWCSNPSCQAGAIYDTSPGSCDAAYASMSPDMKRALGADALNPNRVACPSCNFVMCFEHQTVWHGGISCAEYTALRARGEMSAETEVWLRRLTKRCPGPDCGVLIEKGNACFHMTCTTCGHEFCWECLADWERIRTPEKYDADAHNEGCFFRSEAAPRPNFLHGDTLEAAVAQNEREEPGGQLGDIHDLLWE